jgi:hypothetical protein
LRPPRHVAGEQSAAAGGNRLSFYRRTGRVGRVDRYVAAGGQVGTLADAGGACRTEGGGCLRQAHGHAADLDAMRGGAGGASAVGRDADVVGDVADRTVTQGGRQFRRDAGDAAVAGEDTAGVGLRVGAAGVVGGRRDAQRTNGGPGAEMRAGAHHGVHRTVDVALAFDDARGDGAAAGVQALGQQAGLLVRGDVDAKGVQHDDARPDLGRHLEVQVGVRDRATDRCRAAGAGEGIEVGWLRHRVRRGDVQVTARIDRGATADFCVHRVGHRQQPDAQAQADEAAADRADLDGGGELVARRDIDVAAGVQRGCAGRTGIVHQREGAGGRGWIGEYIANRWLGLRIGR